MKEMTIEQKAEAYNKALRYATIYYNNGNADMKTMMSTCFPELKEEDNEDEKIRKWIIDDIRYNMNNEPLNNSEYKKNAEKAIAWLEKQGEQKIDDDDKAILENWEGIVKDNKEKWQLSDWFVEATLLLVQKIKQIGLSKSIVDNNKTMLNACINVLRNVGHSHLAAWLEKQGDPEDKGEISDGYHTFNELYYYRMLYNAAFFNMLPKEWVHKSKKHNDGEECFGGGWFIVIANLPTGQISNHYELKDWDLFQIPEKERADKWDGHTPQEAAERLHKYLLEKQDGQKPIDKIEPKFKVGEWILNDICFPVQIALIKDGMYIFTEGDAISVSFIDKNYHLWTIQEAKDGDVLTSEDKDKVFIYNGKFDLIGRVCAYCGIYKTYDGFRFAKCAIGNYFTYKEPHPATKEQRDLLFKKIKETGYEWDAEKKELKKIKQKPTEWSGNEQNQDVNIQINPSDYINNMGGNGCYLKNPVQAPAWSEEDEKMFMSLHNLIYVVRDCDCDSMKKRELSDWFESLKDRVQPKQEWSEEDEQYFNFLEKLLENLQVKSTENEIKKGTTNNSKYYYKVIQWLKSLKDRVQPKQ